MLDTVVFRVDASADLGIGHYMRCMVIADQVLRAGKSVVFVSKLITNELELKLNAGKYRLIKLNEGESSAGNVEEIWGVSKQKRDAKQTKEKLSALSGGVWVVVDHYGLDSHWSSEFYKKGYKILVIDDLANRNHACDLLLDQTLGRKKQQYEELVPKECRILVGASYALLRDEFSQIRPKSLKRRIGKTRVNSLTISMGGTDPSNATYDVLKSIRVFCELNSVEVNVIMQTSSRHKEKISGFLNEFSCNTKLHLSPLSMAAILCDSDLVIGASGGSAWERCLLGLPSILLILADNQLEIGKSLMESGAAICIHIREIEDFQELLMAELNEIAFSREKLGLMSKKAAQVVDGRGAERVFESMIQAST